MTGPRNAAAVVSLVLLCTAVGCTNFYEVPIETPIQPKMDVTPFTRILVAGFISGGSDDVDGNLETVRLLRSQLRSKSTLRVIEAEVLPLVDIAREQVKLAAAPTGSETSGGGPGQTPADPPPSSPAPQQPPVGEPQQPHRRRRRRQPGSRPLVQAWNRPTARSATKRTSSATRRSSRTSRSGRSSASSTRIPLIVTGTVLFTNTQSAGFVNQNREIIDPLGRRVVQPYRVYMERKGFIIEPRFVFIDGRTGAVLFSDRFHEEVLYPASQQTPALSSYFELMDRLIPSFLGSLSTQRIRGTRVLLK